MLISSELNQAINTQIGHELGASLQYLSIAGHFERQKLRLLAKLFFKQSEEENQHALKFVNYVLATQGQLAIPAIPAPTPSFASAEVTGQIKSLMDLAVASGDYLAQGMLQWFVDEQLEEIQQASQRLSVIQRAGEKNLLMVEAYLAHHEVGS